MSEQKSKDYVKKRYRCPVCKEYHDVLLNKNLVKGQEKFPITHVFLHGDVYNILTTLYLDADMRIRGVEASELDNSDNIFDKEQMKQMIINVTNELSQLQEEYNDLLEKYDALKEENERLKEKS